jgi:uncharacterized membrane protein
MVTRVQVAVRVASRHASTVTGGSYSKPFLGGILMANFHVIAGAHETITPPIVRTIDTDDLWDALARGFEDFKAKPSHLVFLGMLYPIAGLCLAALTFSGESMHLLFPLVSGFALIGPFAAIGLYEISRRRELGLDTSWRHAFDILRAPSIPSIFALGLLLIAIFAAWIGAAEMLYGWLYGNYAPQSYPAFLGEVLTTPRGWALIILGHVVGLAFAVVVLAISAVSFPLLLDRDVGAGTAVETSVKAVMANPKTMAIWGLIVAGLLIIGSLPFLAGLAVVVPVLGHATWHLYRKVIERDVDQELAATE